MSDFIEIALQKAKGTEFEQKLKDEIDFLSKTEDKDGKFLIKVLENSHNKNKNKIGHKNEINSWLAYFGGLTDKKPDPDAFFMPKRRVYARDGYPDIDTDFDFERRNEIYHYIKEKYGEDRVGNIGTNNSIKLKSFVARAFKALDPDKVFKSWKEGNKIKDNRQEYRTYANDKAREIVDSLPSQYGAQLKIKDKNGDEYVIKNTNDAYKYCDDFRWYIDKYPDILAHSENIEGLLSVRGVHPAGVVLSSVPLAEIAPFRQSKIDKDAEESEEDGPKYTYATQFPSEDLEQLGLIKFDILALSTISVIRRCVKLVKENYNIEIDVENLPLDDSKTYALYRTGKLNGVFQCEEHGMQEVIRQIAPTRFEDIMAAVALFRPGPMDYIPEYCARKHGLSSISYFHKSIEPFVSPYLKTTYGVIVYQEQVMQICNSLAGMTINQGYQVIKAISKKKGLDKHRSKFVIGCVKNGIEEKVAGDYWDKVITPFALYAFNLAHAGAYGYNSYITAYLKANFPEEFMCSYLNVEIGRAKYEKVEKLEKEVKKMNMLILPRKINSCKLEYTIVRKQDVSNGITQSEILPPLRCKGLKRTAAENIVANQPYKGIEDFAARTDPTTVDKSTMEALVEFGFFSKEKYEKFCVIREDLKVARRKGLQSVDIFAPSPDVSAIG